MTQHKDRKATIRARMAVTGEPYAEAARQIRRQPDRPVGQYGLIRTWITAADHAIADPQRRARWGRRATTIRLVLAATSEAAMVAESSVIEAGIPTLALHAGVSYRAAASAVQVLRDEPDPLLELVTRPRAGRADRYRLRIPDAYPVLARQPLTRRPLPGPLDAIARTGHPGHYATQSEARMAVLRSAAVRGWTLADIQTAIDAGTWAGLTSLYSRPGQPGRMTRLLTAEYRRVTAMATPGAGSRDLPSGQRPRAGA